MSEKVDYAAFVGLDWEDKEHDVCILSSEGDIQCEQLEQNPEAIAAWANKLRVRYNGRPVAICIEQARGALIYALMVYDFFVLFPINPKQLSDYRAALYPSGVKVRSQRCGTARPLRTRSHGQASRVASRRCDHSRSAIHE